MPSVVDYVNLMENFCAARGRSASEARARSFGESELRQLLEARFDGVLSSVVVERINAQLAAIFADDMRQLLPPISREPVRGELSIEEQREREHYAQGVMERFYNCSYEELMRGYYLGLNPRPDDETCKITAWDEWE